MDATLSPPHLHPGTLAARVAGPEDGDPVVFLHGFLNDSRSWAEVVAGVLQHHQARCVCLDLPGHGASEPGPDHPDDGVRWRLLLDRLAATIRAWAPAPVVLVGYSLGARVAAQLALQGVLPLAGLVLESAHFGLAFGGERDQRRRLDAARADQLDTGDLGRFVDAWEGLGVLTGQQTRVTPEAWQTQRRQRLDQDPRGLALALRRFGTGTMPALVRSPAPPPPHVRLLAGALDGPYVAQLAKGQVCWPDAHVQVVPGCGHNVHLEHPMRVAEAVLAVLRGGRGA